MVITITILLFSHIHVRHIEPNWTCLRASHNHYIPNQTEPGPVKITP